MGRPPSFFLLPLLDWRLWPPARSAEPNAVSPSRPPGANRKPVMRRDLRAGLVGIDGMLLTLDDVIIDAVFHIGTGVGIFRKEPFVVGFVIGKEQRRFTLAVQ